MYTATLTRSFQFQPKGYIRQNVDDLALFETTMANVLKKPLMIPLEDVHPCSLS